MIVKTSLIKSIFRFVFTFFLCVPFAYGQQSLDVSSIDPELRKNAYVVVRNASIKDVFSSNGDIETTVKETITILHRKGKEYLTFRTNYKKGSSKVHKLRLEYFDAKYAKKRFKNSIFPNPNKRIYETSISTHMYSLLGCTSVWTKARESNRRNA